MPPRRELPDDEVFAQPLGYARSAGRASTADPTTAILWDRAGRSHVAGTSIGLAANVASAQHRAHSVGGRVAGARVVRSRARRRITRVASPDAAALLEQAYALHPEPVLLYNLARALDAEGEIDDARDAHMHDFSHRASSAEQAPLATRRVEVLGAQIAGARRGRASRGRVVLLMPDARADAADARPCAAATCAQPRRARSGAHVVDRCGGARSSVAC